MVEVTGGFDALPAPRGEAPRKTAASGQFGPPPPARRKRSNPVLIQRTASRMASSAAARPRISSTSTVLFRGLVVKKKALDLLHRGAAARRPPGRRHTRSSTWTTITLSSALRRSSSAPRWRAPRMQSGTTGSCPAEHVEQIPRRHSRSGAGTHSLTDGARPMQDPIDDGSPVTLSSSYFTLSPSGSRSHTGSAARSTPPASASFPVHGSDYRHERARFAWPWLPPAICVRMRRWTISRAGSKGRDGWAAGGASDTRRVERMLAAGPRAARTSWGSAARYGARPSRRSRPTRSWPAAGPTTSRSCSRRSRPRAIRPSTSTACRLRRISQHRSSSSMDQSAGASGSTAPSASLAQATAPTPPLVAPCRS